MKTKFFFLSLCLIFTFHYAKAQKSFQVTILGKGEPILFFPGFGCPGEVWEETVAEISKTNECHVFTFAGFGNVPPIDTPWLNTIKNEIITYVKDKKIQKPILIGHSLGGTLSLWLSSLENNLFKKAILVDALPCTAALMIPNYKGDYIEYDNPQSKMMLEMDKSAFEQMNIQTISFMCLNKSKHTILAKWMNAVDRKTYVYGYIDMLNLDLRKEISKIKIPVVILAASNPSLEVVKKTYESQYQNLPSATIQYAEKSAHFVMYDQTEWFINSIKKAIQ
ncbi:Pimeloyl-ACP methyl ester carboxylesterase [Flavobacterium sp. 9AF]|uniref:alpha/beta fold hydrolase n=1 Tax=Flavobacterium sp. 9AF TaxID=2653142 RepID=UPI0012F432AC|nr:alpha/beta hydrolase [Flavobacterium sp. 9AF]VXC07926.1 Pimeloyl-ACP methyl ester carboxylesterase [Flavobacterium sp. 9AF]